MARKMASTKGKRRGRGITGEFGKGKPALEEQGGKRRSKRGRGRKPAIEIDEGY